MTLKTWPERKLKLRERRERELKRTRHLVEKCFRELELDGTYQRDVKRYRVIMEKR